MPSFSTNIDSDPCILEGVQPILSELQTPISIKIVDDDHRERNTVEQFIHQAFRQAYGADVQSYCPTLLSFRDDDRQRAAVGYRDGCIEPLFAEQYLSRPAHEVIASHTGNPIERSSIVEVGNLALGHAGEARWVIAALTIFLHTLGYRWVLFTAIRPLVNAFQRLGMNPVKLAEAHAGQLADKGLAWGSYYDAQPFVCAGNIDSGYQKLHHHVSHSQPMLRALLRDMSLQARDIGAPAQSCCGGR